MQKPELVYHGMTSPDFDIMYGDYCRVIETRPGNAVVVESQDGTRFHAWRGMFHKPEPDHCGICRSLARKDDIEFWSQKTRVVSY